MQLHDIPTQILIHIFLYLSPIEIIRLESCLKCFKDLITSSNQLFQAHFNKIHSLTPSSYQLPWKRISKRLILSPNICNAFLPFYTNGGVKAESPFHFIDKLIRPIGMYSTIMNENVLIKYAYRGKNIFNYESPSHYEIGENIYFIPDIEDFPGQSQQKIPYIEKIVVYLPERNYFPLAFIAFFSSLEKTDPIDVVNMFKGCKSKHKAVSKGKKLGLLCSYQKSKFSTTVFYKRFSADVRPLCWIKIKNNGIVKPDNLTVKLPQAIFARYFYVLMISSDIKVANACMDANYISPICKEIRVVV